MKPQEVEDTGTPRALGQVLLVPRQHTCFMPTSSTHIDYFMASTAVCAAMDRIHVDLLWPKKPHKPVQLHFRHDAVKLQQLVFRSHSRMPTAVPYGPRPCPQDWLHVTRCSELAARTGPYCNGALCPMQDQ